MVEKAKSQEQSEESFDFFRGVPGFLTQEREDILPLCTLPQLTISI
jgi:hypothetical protein